MGLNESKDAQPTIERDLDGIINYIRDKYKDNNLKIITMAGAGISTSAGIPDFRSKNSGLYDNLSEYGLSEPTAIFTLDYFKENPRPFFNLVKKLYKPEVKPTLCHYFIRLLHEKNVLLRHYTQNVDDLERLSGLPEEKFIEAHGNFQSGHCLSCSKVYPRSHLMNFLNSTDEIIKCECGGVVKPDIVMFGEGLPSRFLNSISKDFAECNLLIIMGTSLSVMPFCNLVHNVKKGTPRLYLNLDCCTPNGSGLMNKAMKFYVAGFQTNNLEFENENKLDIFFKCKVDDGVMKICQQLEWDKELIDMKEKRNAELGLRPMDTLVRPDISAEISKLKV